MTEPWYSVRCIFKHRKKDGMTKINLYEERITLWKTSSFNKAIKLAEEEAEDYADDYDCEYLGYAQAYHIDGEDLENGTELFSLMREHNYPPDKYLDSYFDTGFEKD